MLLGLFLSFWSVTIGMPAFIVWYNTPDISISPSDYIIPKQLKQIGFPITVSNNTSKQMMGLFLKVSLFPETISPSDIDFQVSQMHQNNCIYKMKFENKFINFNLPVMTMGGFDLKMSPSYFINIPIIKPNENISLLCNIKIKKTSTKLAQLKFVSLNYTEVYSPVEFDESNGGFKIVLLSCPDMKALRGSIHSSTEMSWEYIK